MKKVLFVASVTSHIIAFHIPYLKMFKDAKYEVHVASNGDDKIDYCDKHFNISFERSPFNKENISAYKELKKIIINENYDIIICNTPVASVITRLAAKESRKNGVRVIYIAHGFHFFKGASLKNWLIYYPIEKYLSKYTDDLITINEEDYEIAKKKMKAKKIHYIHGIGVDETKFNKQITKEERKKLRDLLNIKKEDFAIFYVGELSYRKNQIMLIDAMKDLVKENKNIKLLLAGSGGLTKFYKEKIKEYNLEQNVILLGYRSDIPNILKAVDLYVSTSKQEGLPINILEAKVSGLPIIVTNSRGNRDLIKDSINGFVVEIGDVETLKEKIKAIKSNEELRKNFINNSKEDVEQYSLKSVENEFKKIINMEGRG